MLLGNFMSPLWYLSSFANPLKHSSKCTYHPKTQIFWDVLGLLYPEDEGNMNLLNVGKVITSQKTSVFSNTTVRSSTLAYVRPALELQPSSLLTQYIFAFRMIPTSKADYWAHRRRENFIPQRLSVLESNDAILAVFISRITAHHTVWKVEIYILAALAVIKSK